MTDAVRFLTTFTQALATMTLYEDGHPARERAVDTAYAALDDLQRVTARPLFTFLGEDVVCGKVPIRELKDWEWARRLSDAGVQRLEFDEEVGREDFELFLEEVLGRLTLSTPPSVEARPMRRSGVRFGAVGVRGEATDSEPAAAVAGYSLNVEADAIRWLHEQMIDRGELHLSEAETVVRSLSLAMHADQHMMIPLLRLRRYDEYTTSHSMNVAVLAMAFAEFLGVGARDVRAFGVAGLLHDIGKTRIPMEVLTKPGRLTDQERDLMNRHPADGARIIIETEDKLDLAAVVAYEHHIMLDGRGYPAMKFPRDCHYGSKLVHICDVYDALRTRRPYRDAWPAARVLEYITERSGREFEPDLAASFVRMMRLWEERVAHVDENQDLTAALRDNAPAANGNGDAHAI